MRFSLLILFLLFAMFSEADTLNISKFIVLDNDTLFTSEIPQLDIIGFKDFKDNKKYRKLKRRVLKVYPFALETKVKLDELNSSLDLIKRKRKQRKYTRKVAKIIKDEYTKSLRKLTIKEGTQNGTKVKLKGKGFPKYKEENAFGDLYVTYEIKVPSTLSRKQKELYKELLTLED